jgi:phosphate transport system ATP-binding protein
MSEGTTKQVRDRPEISVRPDGLRERGPVEHREKTFELKDVSVHYGANPAVKNVTMDIYRNNITALIGPSGCGKSTLLRCLNRMNDLIPSARVDGQLLYHGADLYGPINAVMLLR